MSKKQVCVLSRNAHVLISLWSSTTL